MQTLSEHQLELTHQYGFISDAHIINYFRGSFIMHIYTTTGYKLFCKTRAPEDMERLRNFMPRAQTWRSYIDLGMESLLVLNNPGKGK